MTIFKDTLHRFTGRNELTRGHLETIQVNVGLRCNLSCQHCHVAASPKRTELMTWPVMQEVLRLAEQSRCKLVDITGGAPEFNPHLNDFIAALHTKKIPIQVRTNLSVHQEPGLENMASFFRDRRVVLAASLPCYLESNVDQQRGSGTFQKAIATLQRFNDLGYGHDPDLLLNLVYNPMGPQLPPDPCRLEADYRRELKERYGIVFSRLLAITNMPVGRFRAHLSRHSQEASYRQLLLESFNPDTLHGLMCLNQVSIAWDGTLFDCDFNLALRRPVQLPVPPHITGLDPAILSKRPIVIDDHCFACTAGRGSSCSGTLVA
ncbi:MAG: arsenosugar biosynthesis radical SAM protein ArsS [Magnetococcales bacterium]|nr:arsenosugar biosynthesis radical SAM protein ArsS [Magnetococcales bacterium]